jgi:hypothetical protein
VAAPLPRSVPDADSSVIYEFAMDSLIRALQANKPLLPEKPKDEAAN